MVEIIKTAAGVTKNSTVTCESGQLHPIFFPIARFFLFGVTPNIFIIQLLGEDNI